MANGSNGEIVKTLRAGAVSEQIQAAGDFVFLREAPFPVRVIINGDAVTMEAGEKRRLDRDLSKPDQPAFSGFQVDNTASVAQRVEFVVGEGDYEKIIVSGKLNVSAYVSSAAYGQFKSLPFDLARRVGVENVGEFIGNAGDKLWGYVDSGNTQGAGEVAYFEGYYYAFDRQHKLYRWSADTPDTTIENVGTITGDSFSPYTPRDLVIYNGALYFTISPGGGKHGLYRVSLAGLQSTKLFDHNAADTADRFPRQNNVGVNTYSGDGAFLRDGEYWLFTRNEDDTGHEFRIFPIGSNQIIRRVAVPGAAGIVGTNHIDMHSTPDGSICYLQHGSSGAVMYKLDAGTGVIDPAPVPGDNINSWPGRIHPDGTEMSRMDQGSLTGWGRYTLTDYVKYADFYVQEGADVATKRTFPVLEPFDYYVNNAGDTVIIGGVIGRVLEAVTGEPQDNALDYVTSFTFDDGRVVRTVASGTETFAMRGIDDGFPVVSGTDVTIGIMPEYFE